MPEAPRAAAPAAARPKPRLAPPRPKPRPAPAVVRVASSAAEGVVDAGRSPWLPPAVLAAIALYLSGQRILDRGSKLRHAGGRGEPDDEVIDL